MTEKNYERIVKDYLDVSSNGDNDYTTKINSTMETLKNTLKYDLKICELIPT